YTELAPILAAEVIRPPSAYRAALVVDPPQYVRLQFEATQNGLWRSPQVTGKGPGAHATELAELRSAIDLSRLTADLPSTPLPTVEEVGKNAFAANAPAAGANADGENAFEFLQANSANAAPQTQQVQINAPTAPTEKGTKQTDLEQRGKRYQSA